MAFPGTIATGYKRVLINEKRAARKADFVSHGSSIGEGEPTVVIASIPAARKFDRYICESTIPEPHVGGAIADGSPDVIIGGQPAARLGDVTRCLGEGMDISGLVATPVATGTMDAAAAAECAELWKEYQREAEALIAPGDDNHRKRNHIINGAYANLYANNPRFVWAGLGAYASKQVGCAMDHSVHVIDTAPTDAQRAIAAYTYEQLGQGNRDLFLDVYPQHRFYDDHGFARFKECAGEKVPPVSAAMLDGFEALDRYDKTGDPKHLDHHLESVAYHEQVFILQRGIYNKNLMRRILDANEGNVDDAASDLVPDLLPNAPKGLVELGGGKPADVVMTSECTDTSPGKKKTIPFNPDDPDRNLYDMDDRMEWIMDDIGGFYKPHHGSRDHLDDLDRLRDRGRAQGAKYP